MTEMKSSGGTSADPWLSPDQQHEWRSLLAGLTLLLDHMDRGLREHSDLSLPEYEILVRLSEAPGRQLRMAQLADSISHSRSRVTHTVARLERAGVVQRRACESDGRGVNAELTELGWRRLTEAAPQHVRKVRAALIDQVTAEDLATVGRVFREVADAVTAHADAAASPDRSDGAGRNESSRLSA
jgi:DNA-binding MarR family transcriptional regulator